MSFRNLDLWNYSHQFVLMVYKYTKGFPKDETYGLTSQFRRAAVSIAANLAEGYPKQSMKDKIRFYEYSQSSIEECQYYLILSNDLEYGENSKLTESLDTVRRMLVAYIKKMKSSNS